MSFHVNTISHHLSWQRRNRKNIYKEVVLYMYSLSSLISFFLEKAAIKVETGLFMSFNQKHLIFSNSKVLFYKNITKTWQIGKSIKQMHPKASTIFYAV